MRCTLLLMYIDPSGVKQLLLTIKYIIKIWLWHRVLWIILELNHAGHYNIICEKQQSIVEIIRSLDND